MINKLYQDYYNKLLWYCLNLSQKNPSIADKKSPGFIWSFSYELRYLMKGPQKEEALSHELF